MPLKVTYQGIDEVVDDDVTALIGSDAASTIRIVRPGISRRHAVLSHDGTGWKIEDAGSRNGTYKDGQRIQVVAIEAPATLYLGHPTDGEALTLTPISNTEEPIAQREDEAAVQEDIDAFVLPAPPPSPQTGTDAERELVSMPNPSRTTGYSGATDVDLAALTAALRDQINAVKGLAWSIWAMIAVTAALVVMTLFIGILRN
ncbi:MAG: hypothetical protein BMS9Abin20_0438 [Acidimicrobiia bacterium]|nr:MAG: hypothetical protein BMS9Abin20_0438 [Acidimicrobiia bacterium]